MSFNNCLYLDKDCTGDDICCMPDFGKESGDIFPPCRFGSAERAKEECPCYEDIEMVYPQVSVDMPEKSDKHYDDNPFDDQVNHPSHYTSGRFECIDVIYDILSSHTDPISAWLTGQIVKYIWRWNHKNGVEDLKKANFYLNKLIEHEEDKEC